MTNSISRRALLGGALAASTSGCFRLARPPPLEHGLSDHARILWRRAWSGLDPAKVLDTHVHVVGLGHDGTGCSVNPTLTQPLAHPSRRCASPSTARPRACSTPSATPTCSTSRRW